MDERFRSTVKGLEAVIESEIERCARFTGTPTRFVTECLVQAICNVGIRRIDVTAAYGPGQNIVTFLLVTLLVFDLTGFLCNPHRLPTFPDISCISRPVHPREGKGMAQSVNETAISSLIESLFSFLFFFFLAKQ